MCLLLLFMVYIVGRNRKQIWLGRKITVRWTIFLLPFLYFQYFFVRLLCFSKFFFVCCWEYCGYNVFIYVFYFTSFVCEKLFFLKDMKFEVLKLIFSFIIYFLLLAFVLEERLYKLSTFTKYIKCLCIMLKDREESH